MPQAPRNPFKPTAGMNPPELVGRDSILEDFTEALENGPGAPERLMRISGVRGTGKTVLLNAVGDIARSKGFKVVDIASNAGFCTRLRELLTHESPSKHVTVEPSVLGVSLGAIELTKGEPLLGEVMLATSKKGGLLVTLDEIQDASPEEMREFGNEIQLLIRQKANVAFVFAGLPTAVDGIIGDETLTFLQRARAIELNRLADSDVAESLRDTFQKTGKEVSEEIVDSLTQAVSGYPFMLQLVGYYTWQATARRKATKVTQEDVTLGLEKGRSNFESMVIAPALRRLPERQQEYLCAMARCEGSSIATGEIARAMNLTTSEIGSYRKRLIDANIIEGPAFGKVSFAIPYMREYLLRKIDVA